MILEPAVLSRHARLAHLDRAVGRQAGRRHRTRTSGKTLDRNGTSHVGYSSLRSAVNDHSRPACGAARICEISARPLPLLDRSEPAGSLPVDHGADGTPPGGGVLLGSG